VPPRWAKLNCRWWAKPECQNHEQNSKKSMSNMTILKALERMGYKGRMTGHGFRGLASTILHECPASTTISVRIDSPFLLPSGGSLPH